MEDTREECYRKLISRLDTKINLKFQFIPRSNTLSLSLYISLSLSLSLSLGYRTNQLMLCKEIIHHFFMRSIANKWSEVKLKWVIEVKWSVSYGEFLVGTGAMYIMVTLYWGNLIILWLFHLGMSRTVFVLICTVVVLNCFVKCVCVRVCVCMGGFCDVRVPWNVYTLNLFGYPDWGFSVLFSQL
jgi:hypothetical protein